MGYTDVIRNISADQPALATIDRLAQVQNAWARSCRPIRVWRSRAWRLRAIAQIGQTYTRDRYDRERSTNSLRSRTRCSPI
jgi:hypothetical protein